MRIQIDTELKTVKLEKSENLGKIFDFLEKVVENWREYKLELVDIVIVQNIPNIVYIDRPYWQPVYNPIQYPVISNPYPYFGTTTANGTTGNSRIINNTGTHTLDTSD